MIYIVILFYRNAKHVLNYVPSLTFNKSKRKFSNSFKSVAHVITAFKSRHSKSNSNKCLLIDTAIPENEIFQSNPYSIDALSLSPTYEYSKIDYYCPLRNKNARFKNSRGSLSLDIETSNKSLLSFEENNVRYEQKLNKNNINVSKLDKIKDKLQNISVRSQENALKSIIDEVRNELINKPIEYSNYSLAQSQENNRLGHHIKKYNKNYELLSIKNNSMHEMLDDKNLNNNDKDKYCSYARYKILAFDLNSTDYSGGSDRYVYSGHRAPTTRNIREREAEMRETIEPIESQYHHHHHYRHHRESSVKRGQFTRSLSNNEPPPDEKTGNEFFIIAFFFFK